MHWLLLMLISSFGTSKFVRPVKVLPFRRLLNCLTMSSFAVSSASRSIASFDISKIPAASVSFIDAALSKNVDDTLMQVPGFSIDQLMELAGYSVAWAAHSYYIHYINEASEAHTSYERTRTKSVLIFCGPGNNGGDGLVAARHLKQFGYAPSIVYPKQGKSGLFSNLVKQLEHLDIAILPTAPSMEEIESHELIIDSLFGFSFQGPSREPYTSMIEAFIASKVPVMSVDIPSGWNVDEGDVFNTGFTPQAVISLTVPKLCTKSYTGVHYIGGRFVPPKLATELKLELPDYGFGPAQIVEVMSDATTGHCESDTAVGTEVATEPITAMFVTAGSKEEADKLADGLISRKVAACVNIIPQIESVYEWEGKVERSQEFLLMIKTRVSLKDEVTKTVKELHSYDVPESIAVDITGGNRDYIQWVGESTK